jgi:hypothetical protein
VLIYGRGGYIKRPCSWYYAYNFYLVVALARYGTDACHYPNGTGNDCGSGWVDEIIHTKTWNPRENTLHDYMPLFWWHRAEEIGLLAATCALFLKSFIKRMLSRFGVSRFRFATIGLNTIHSSPEDVTKDAKKDKFIYAANNGKAALGTTQPWPDCERGIFGVLRSLHRRKEIVS